MVKQAVIKNVNILDRIIDAIARCFFCDAWASAMEEAGRSSEMSQREILDIAPETNEEAYNVAVGLVRDIEAVNGITFTAWVEMVRALPRDKYSDRDINQDDIFGHYLAMESLGHGVTLSEHLEKVKLKIPYSDGLIVSVKRKKGKRCC